MFKRIKRLKSYTKENTKYYCSFPFIDGSYMLIEDEEYKNLHYFCDDEGIKYGTGTKNTNNLIIPKEIFIEAFNKYISN